MDTDAGYMSWQTYLMINPLSPTSAYPKAKMVIIPTNLTGDTQEQINDKFEAAILALEAISAAGPTGAAGATGAAGPTGPTGPTGGV